MGDFNKVIQPFLDKTILREYNFGFTGEAYISIECFEADFNKYYNNLSKYFSLKKPYYCNRNKAYYSTDLSITIDLINSIPVDAEKIIYSNLQNRNKRFIIFSLTQYMLSNISKIMGTTFAYIPLMNSYYYILKRYLVDYCDYMVRIIFNENFSHFPILPNNIINNIAKDMAGLNITQVREYSEMDNIMILFVTYLALYDYVGKHNVIISPLQGAVLIPPFYIAMQEYTSLIKSDLNKEAFDYVRFSRYDNSHYHQTSLKEQVQVLCDKHKQTDKIIVIDDNTGTALTLKNIKQELNKYFDNVCTSALEFFWEGKIFMTDIYPAFRLDDVDYISPLCYRHFKLFDEHIPYIINDNHIHNWYRDDSFYKLKYIFNDHDFYSYINENCEDGLKRASIFEVCSRFEFINKSLNIKV